VSEAGLLWAVWSDDDWPDAVWSYPQCANAGAATTAARPQLIKSAMSFERIQASTGSPAEPSLAKPERGASAGERTEKAIEAFATLAEWFPDGGAPAPAVAAEATRRSPSALQASTSISGSVRLASYLAQYLSQHSWKT
jgi:hypothetical protein